MQGIYDFIVHIEKAFRETLTHGSLTLHVDHNLDRTEHSNRVAKVVSAPLALKSEILSGDEVLIVQTIVMPHITKDGRRPSPYMVDREKKLYRVPDSMVVMFRRPGGEWRCNGNNVLVVPIEEERIKEHNGLVQVSTEKAYSDQAIIAYSNAVLSAQGVSEMDSVIVDKALDHEYKLEGVLYWRMQDHHVLAKVISR